MAVARLFFTASIEEQWQTVTGPWLREMEGAAWKNPRPTVILTPSRAESFYIRSRLVEEGMNFLGLRFWTPSDARTFLLGELSPEIATATQTELRLVARMSAEALLKSKKVTDQATLTSTVQEPGAFLRAYDLLWSAGWDPAQAGVAYGRGLAAEMNRQLEQKGIATQAGVHRQLLERLASVPEEPLLANLLVVGFNAAHWPLWDLLRATVSTAGQAVIALSEPRVFGEVVDQLWISSWEEVLKTSVQVPEGPIDEVEEGPFVALVKSYEGGTQVDAREANLSFLVAPDLASQAQAIVLQTVDYLKRDSCTRLGIVFPEANALALEVAEQLAKLDILIDDGTGSIRPGIFESRAWAAWLALQEEASVARVGAWLRACEAQGVSSGLDTLTAREATDLLDQALGESLVDDLDFLARYLEETSASRRAGALTDFLQQRIMLPETGSFTEFLTLTRQALVRAGWEDHLAKLQMEPPPWLARDASIISRKTFLGWLRESTDSQMRIRGAQGNHFYGKVHLVIYAQMTGQTWSHLILTGLNEGVWPRVFESEAFGSRHELAALNLQARDLNRQSTTQGGQGEGHETVRANHGHCLLPLERLDLSLRDLCAALEGTSEAVCLAAMTTDGGRTLLPSDFFNHAYHAKIGAVLDEESFRKLAGATSAWCEKHQALLRSSASKISADIAATKVAYDARRNSALPFGPYEFSYSEPPAFPIQLSCKTWEEALNHPSSVWLSRIVGVESWPEGRLSWPRAVGTWVHRWLTTALRTCGEGRSLDDFLPLLRDAAANELLRTQERAKAAGIALYPWWEQVWRQAESITLGLGEALVPVLAGKSILSEFRLPENVRVALPGSDHDDFKLTGRIDLLLIETGSAPADIKNGDFSKCSCWVIDFKTGSAPSLTPKKIGEGTGLQAVLYALAVRARGAGPTAISLHTFSAPLKPQVQLDAALEMVPLFRSLDLIHRAGIFGMRGDAENEYGFSPAYPMATRFVATNILEAKWERIHGASSVDQGDDE